MTYLPNDTAIARRRGTPPPQAMDKKHLQMLLTQVGPGFEALGQVIIAGGAVRDILSRKTPDRVDLWLLDAPKAKEVLEHLLEFWDGWKGLQEVEQQPDDLLPRSLLLLEFTWMTLPVRVYSTRLKTPEELLAAFDWDLERFALWGVGGRQASVLECADSQRGTGGNFMTFNPATLYSASASLQRGYRLAEATGMIFGNDELEDLCRGVLVDMGTIVEDSPPITSVTEVQAAAHPKPRKKAPVRKTKKKKKAKKKKAVKKA